MASTIPAVIEELQRAVALALPGVQVVDGEPVAPSTTEFVAIAFTGEEGESSVEAIEDRAQMAASPDRERYDVYCFAWAQVGQTDAQAVRRRVFEFVEGVRGALQRDSTLGGLVMSARLAVLAYTGQQTPQGAEAGVRFAVRIDAFAR